MSQVQAGSGTSQIRDYLGVLWRRKWWVIAVTAIAVAAAAAYIARQTPLYSSQAQVLVGDAPTSANSGAAGAAATALSLDTEAVLATTPEVAEVAADELGTDEDPEDLRGGLSVTVAPNTNILLFDYVSTDADVAHARSQAFADAYVKFRKQQALERLDESSKLIQKQIATVNEQLRATSARLDRTSDPARVTELRARLNSLQATLVALQQNQLQLTPSQDLEGAEVVAPAEVPAAPFSPTPVKTGGLALLMGVALGVALAFLRERFDDSLRGRPDLESHLGAAALALVPKDESWRKRKQAHLVTRSSPNSAASEAYRTLRTGLLFAASQRGLRTVLVTSALRGEGKSVTAANLALALAQAGKHVIVVSADLRTPRLHEFFGVRSTPGLTNVLAGEDTVQQALVASAGVDNLRVLASGPVPGNPTDILGSDRMGELLSTLRELADFVIIDATPVLSGADAMTLAPQTDAVLFVADPERATGGDVAEARLLLDQVNARVIGAVLNNFDPSMARASASHYAPYNGGGPGASVSPALIAARWEDRRP